MSMMVKSSVSAIEKTPLSETSGDASVHSRVSERDVPSDAESRASVLVSLDSENSLIVSVPLFLICSHDDTRLLLRDARAVQQQPQQAEPHGCARLYAAFIQQTIYSACDPSAVQRIGSHTGGNFVQLGNGYTTQQRLNKVFSAAASASAEQAGRVELVAFRGSVDLQVNQAALTADCE